MARIVDAANESWRVVDGAGSSFLGSPPAKRDSGETLAFSELCVLCVTENSGARVPRTTVAGSSARGAAKPVALKIHLMCETPQKATHRWCNGAMPRRTDRAR